MDNKLREQYLIVKEYLKKHPNSNAMQITIETGVDISKVLKFVKEGYFSITNKD